MSHIRVDPLNTNNKWIGFELANVDMFIIPVGFGLANVDTIRILTRHKHDPLTQIATPICTGSFLFFVMTSIIISSILYYILLLSPSPPLKKKLIIYHRKAYDIHIKPKSYELELLGELTI